MVMAENSIERAYNDYLDQLSGPERVAHAFGLFEGTVAAIEHQIRLEHPEISDRELRLRTAEILYVNDSETQRLLKLVRDLGSS